MNLCPLASSVIPHCVLISYPFRIFDFPFIVPISFGVILSSVSFIAGVLVLYTGPGIIQSLPEQCHNGRSEIVGPAHS